MSCDGEAWRTTTWWYLCDSCGRKRKDRGMHECWCCDKVVQKKATNGTQAPAEVCPHWKEGAWNCTK